ncbi:TonB-dependent receptor [Sphingobium sp. Sx8-8]|uniref:TonB-dependent receptor n=1 Tax=Sphingobium sp. Sx8-8 TaxID=2933617 RepID=UPI001F584365|nr:TonB-dependent receptor [Sphingobium sp. Sx8-8]
METAARIRLSIGTAMVLLMPVAAFAQADMPRAGQGNGAGGNQDIIVTAQRREQRLQDIPISISAFRGDALQSMGINSTRDLTLVTPGLNFTQSSFSPQPTIRGIGTRGVTASEESVVPVYIDGVYQPFLASTVFDLYDIERIEVLRGPQTALYGRNSTGGAINIITLSPSETPRFKASISYGRFNEVNAKAYVTAGTETVQASLALLRSYDDGYITNLNPIGEAKLGWSRSWSVHGKLRFVPADNLELILSGLTMRHEDTLSTSSQPYRGNTAARRLSPGTYVQPGPYEQTGTGGGLFQTDQNLSLTAKLSLDWADITSISAYDDSWLYTRSDVDASALNVSSLPNDYFSRSFIQELYATSSHSGPFSWIAGGTYFWRDSGSYRVQVINGSTVATDYTASQVTRSLAAYAQGSYDFGGGLSLILAGRYTWEKKEHHYRDNLSGLTTTGERTFTDFSPSGTLKYDVSPTANVYARVGKGFKSGLFATSTPSYNPATGVSNAVNPEKVWQYELGTKFSIARRIRANLSGFYTDYSDIQVSVRPNNVSILQNASGAEIYGFEGEMNFEPVDGLNLHLGAMKLWGHFKDYQNAVGQTARTNLFPSPTNAQVAGCPTLPGTPVGGNVTCTFDASGQTITRTPLFTINGSIAYTAQLANGGALTFNANAYHAGKEYRDADNRVTLPGYTLVNGEIGYRLPNSRMTVSAWARNLFNEAYNLYILTGPTADTTLYGRPRTFGVRLDMDFGG